MKHIALMIMAVMTAVMAGCSSTKVLTAEEIQKHQQAVAQLKDKNFVITANRLMLDKRNFPAVSPSTNFIKVDGDQAVVQVNPGMGGGPNGIGGFTVKGTVSGYDVKAKDNGAVSVRFGVNSPVGSCTVFINLPKNGVSASATIQNNLRGGNAIIYGDVQDLDAPVVTGRTIN